MESSVETGECVWTVTNRHVFGFRVEKLEELGKNELRRWNLWKSNLVAPPFDFYFKLPARDMRPFLLNSNLYFTAAPPLSSTNIHRLSYVGDATLDITEAGVIPPPPSLVYRKLDYVANIQGDTYLLVHDDLGKETGFWVLRSGSGSKEWHPLPLPTLLSSYSDYWDCLAFEDCFVWKDKLFLEVNADPKALICPENIIFYVYDDGDHSWQQLIKEKLPFSYTEYGYHPPSMMHVSSLGDVGNCSVAMTWSMEGLLEFDVELKIHALLVDNQDYCISRKQCLDEACEAIVPDFFDCSIDINVNFVDLGKGKVCVFIGGVTGREFVLCVLVLGLSLLQEADQDQGQGQRFLSVDVLANQVYNMLPYTDQREGFEVPYTSFLLSLKQDQISLSGIKLG